MQELLFIEKCAIDNYIKESKNDESQSDMEKIMAKIQELFNQGFKIRFTNCKFIKDYFNESEYDDMEYIPIDEECTHYTIYLRKRVN